MKQIKDFPNYFIDEKGNVYSSNKHVLKQIKPWIDSKGNYYMIRIIKDNVQYRKLVHRLVAETFVPNPNQLPEVNHIDNNPRNNNVNNLEWCTRKYNLEKSYETMSPKRYFKHCILYVDGVNVGEFSSCLDAAKYANKNYGLSISSIRKYHKCKNAYIQLK